MARPAKKQAPQKFEEPEEAEGWEDAVVEADGKDGADSLRLRDWRDVERFREMKDLRRLVDDDYGLEEIFHVPLKPRADALPRASKLVLPAKLQVAKAAPPARPEAKVAAKAPLKVVAKALPAKKAAPAHKPKAAAAAKVKPKAKKR